MRGTGGSSCEPGPGGLGCRLTELPEQEAGAEGSGQASTLGTRDDPLPHITGPQAGISAPSSRRGQTEAAIGHLRLEGDMGRELPRSIWSREGGCVAAPTALRFPRPSLAQLKAAKT